MTLIRVIPEMLNLTSGKMSHVNGEIRNAVAELSSVLGGIGNDYGGQLRRQVESKVGQAQSAASGPTNRVNQLTLELTKRAKMFAHADNVSNAALVRVLPASVDADRGLVFEHWVWLSKLPWWVIWTWWQLGLFGGLPVLDLIRLLPEQPSMSKPPWSWIPGFPPSYLLPLPFLVPPIMRILPVPGSWIRFPGIRLPWQTPIATQPRVRTLPVTIIREPDTRILPPAKVRVQVQGPHIDGVAPNVTGSEDGYYWRYGFTKNGTPKSDCTWYAARAVKYASGGKIDLLTMPDKQEAAFLRQGDQDTIDQIHADGRMTRSLGNGGQWARNAEAYQKKYLDGPISGVDRTPKPGDVVSFENKGHVAFVESAELVEGADGKWNWVIRISEEDATGIGFKGGTRVEVDGDSDARRWVRVITYPATADHSEIDAPGVRFIHFNYEDSSYTKEVDPNTLA